VALAPLALFDHVGDQGHLALRFAANSPGWTGPLHAEAERTGPGAVVARWAFGFNFEIPALARTRGLAVRASNPRRERGSSGSGLLAIDRPGYHSGGGQATRCLKYLYSLRF